jgi:uncharacterized protein YuzE
VKIKKDLKNDVAYITLRKGKVSQTVELRPGLIFDFDSKGEILGIEVLSLEKLAPALQNSKRDSSVA